MLLPGVVPGRLQSLQLLVKATLLLLPQRLLLCLHSLQGLLVFLQSHELG